MFFKFLKNTFENSHASEISYETWNKNSRFWNLKVGENEETLIEN